MSEIRELEEGLQGQTKAAIASASHHLNHDDRWLQKLAAASALDMDDGKESKARVTSLTAKLSELTREEIQCRLNRVYLQRLMGSDQNGMLEQSELGEQELEQDLESLHVEITDVAAMSVFQDFTAPMLAALAEHQNKKNEEARSVLENVLDLFPALSRPDGSDRCR